MLMFASNHREMNSSVFKFWMETALLPTLAAGDAAMRRAVFVLDRAPYHTMLTELSKGAT